MVALGATRRARGHASGKARPSQDRACFLNGLRRNSGLSGRRVSQSLLSVMPALTGGFVVSRVWSLASPIFGQHDYGVFNAVTATLQVPRQFLNPVVLSFVRYPSLLCRVAPLRSASTYSRLKRHAGSNKRTLCGARKLIAAHLSTYMPSWLLRLLMNWSNRAISSIAQLVNLSYSALFCRRRTLSCCRRTFSN